MKFQYEFNGTSHSIDLTQTDTHHFTVTLANRVVELTAIQQANGSWRLQTAQQTLIGHIVADGDYRHIHLNGTTYTLKQVNDRQKRRKQSGTAGDLTAQMPGQVVEVSVQSGDVVTAGQTLVILEAMKMEIRVTAPTDGVVKDVFVETTQIVERGQRLIELNDKP